MRKYIFLGKSWDQISRQLDGYCQHWERYRSSVWSPSAPRFVRKSVLAGTSGTDAHFTYCDVRGDYAVSLLFLDVRHNELDLTCSIGIESTYVGRDLPEEETRIERFAEEVLSDLLTGPDLPESRPWSCPLCGAVYDIAVLRTRGGDSVQCQNCNEWVSVELEGASDRTDASDVHDPR